MVTGELKNKIDGLWEVFWTGGLTNPLDVVEQLTYLFFMHDLDDLDNRKSKESIMLDIPFKSIFPESIVLESGKTIPGSHLKWSFFKDLQDGEYLLNLVSNGVFPFIKNISEEKSSSFAKNMKDAVFKIPTAAVLSNVIKRIDNIYSEMSALKDSDIRGDVYEYLLSKIAQSGVNGQFRTPRHIIEMMVNLVKPQPDDVICDPACGTAGFLVGAVTYLRQHHLKEIMLNEQTKERFMHNTFFGYDTDSTMLRIASMNMLLHSIEDPKTNYQDSISNQNKDIGRYSLILANPPFKGSVDVSSINDDIKKVCNTKKTELLFIAMMLRMLRIGGRCACIVPSGVLFGSSKAHKDIRKMLVEENTLQAVISMPSGVFKPYAGVSTAVLVFTKTGRGGTDDVWFYDMEADGFSLDDKRSPVKENDIPDVIARFGDLDKEKERARTEKSFMVKKQEIVDNDYDLSFNKYKEVVHEKIEYPPTKDLLADIKKLQIEISDELNELELLLKAQQK